ncbi:sulfurtransferase complex subunit TusB [Parahalioglobus pacificus]|uniref:tRNA 2-thiouridine synthesizing protein B n=1 Tax=Parahalioglobus pacificus TaxID=930806 RepID=A0A918XG74_9GAMM|nr:sulfurtransferase complex subunit TusB [Halioglobus pacificus]GHD29871.1 hypothetical protein GCM10007053_11050 [Halioglobus pacificus]
MILHTLSTMPSSDAARRCVEVASTNDALILLGEGVYAAMAGDTENALATKAPCTVFALLQDVKAAGIEQRLSPGVEVIDFAGFVALTEQYSKQQAWF